MATTTNGGKMRVPFRDTITRRKQLAQDARNELQSFRKYGADSWKSSPETTMALQYLGQLARLEGYTLSDTLAIVAKGWRAG